MIPSGETKFYRITAPDSPGTFVIPDNTSCMVIKNVGANAVQINFSEDDASDYWTIKVDAVTPVFSVLAGRTLNIDGVGGASTLEIIVWG